MAAAAAFVPTLEANALTTPARMRTARNLSATTYPDGLLIPKINAVSQIFSEICHRNFGFQRFAGTDFLFLAGNGMDKIFVPIKPIRALTSVKIGENIQVIASSYSVDTSEQENVYRVDSDSDKIGMLLRPSRWPMRVPCHRDVTGNPNFSAPRALNIAIQGDFGFILPQFDGVTDATHNPDNTEANIVHTDIPPVLEDLCWQECEERLWTRPRPGLKSELTAGGAKKEFFGAGYLAEREEHLRWQLRGFMNAEAVMS